VEGGRVPIGGLTIRRDLHGASLAPRRIVQFRSRGRAPRPITPPGHPTGRN